MKDSKILLVDDDHGVNFLNRHILQECGLQGPVEVAINGQLALEAIAAGFKPDVIFLDINMPVMDGFEFLEHFKTMPEMYNGVKVYMLTSSLRESDKSTALTYGCVKGYLEKPLNIEVIMEIFKP